MTTLFRPLVLLLLLLPLSAQAEGAGARLDRLLDGIKSLRSQFEQTVISASNDVAERSTGEMLLQRPGRFRLEYRKPYEQLYIADGKKVWAYDKDLAQVTVRPLDQALGSTPAVLLSGGEPLERNFEVIDKGERNGQHWFELRPKAGDAQFDHIRLAVDQNSIQVMEMVDTLGQTTRLRFEQIERNPSLPADAFRFTPPPGVDVVGETG